MPRQPPPRDRFDDLPPQRGRVGAHRAENPHLRGWVVFAWAVAATIVLVAGGIFGTMLVSGRISLTPAPSPTVTPTPTITPVVDTSFSVLVLNATTQTGLAAQAKDLIVQAGWPPTSVNAGDAGTTDFATTTVYYVNAADQPAALGLAKVLGGAQVQQSDAYAQIGGSGKQLTVVLGRDRMTPSPTPSK